MCSRDAINFLTARGAISSVPLPIITAQDANKLLVVNATGTAYTTSAGQPVAAGVNSIAVGDNTIGINPPEGTGNVTLVVNPDLELTTLTVGNVIYPAVLGTNGQVLSVVDGALAFAAGGGGNMLPAGDNINYDNDEVNLAANITNITSIQTAALTVGELTIPSTLGTNDQVLGVSGGQLTFINQTGSGGIAAISGSGNISIDSITDPQIPAISTVDIPTFHSMNLEVSGSIPYINVTEQIQLTSTNIATGVKMYLMKDQIAQIEIDGVDGIISTNVFELNSGTTQNIDYVQSSGVMTQEAYIYTSLAGSENFPSYNLPKITDDSNLAQNLIMTTTIPVNNNNPMGFVTLDAMFDVNQDIRYSSNGTDNKIISELNTANNKASGLFLQCTGANNGDLTWAAITQSGTIEPGLNIEVSTAGQTTTISVASNPSFPGTVTCQGNLSCETLTFATFDVSIPTAPSDIGKVLTFTDADGSAGINWVTPSAQTLTEGTNINITDNAINLDTDIEINALTLNGTVLTPPQATDASKFLQYNQSSNIMQWIDVAGGGGVQSVTGTLNQIDITGPLETPTIGFPMTTMHFPFSVVTRTEEGFANVGIGESTLALNEDGIHNIAVGDSCLSSNTSGQYNIAIGSEAMSANTVGTLNIAIGKDALGGNTASSNNVIIGGNAAPNLGSTGVGNGGNVIIGTGTAASLTTGENNIIIGTSVDVSASTSNRIVLGNGTNNQLSIPGCGIDYDITSGNALTIGNSVRAGSMATPSLSVYDVSNSATLYTLPTITTGNLPAVGDVIAYQANGQCTFVTQGGGGGGNVNEVTGGTNITVTGTTADPVVNLNPVLTAVESISMTGATSVITTGTTTQFVANSGGAGQVIQLLGTGGATAISLDSNSGIIKTANYIPGNGISSGNHIQTTDVIAQSMFVTSKLQAGDLYSYKFPEITTAAAIPVNSLLAMTGVADINFSQTASFTTLNNLIASATCDVLAGTPNGSNQVPLTLKTSNGKTANYILAVNSDGLTLEWIFNANTSSTTVYQIVNNSGTNTAFNMCMTAYARPDGFRTITIAGVATTGVDNHSPFVVQSQSITVPIELPFNLTSSCLVYLSGNNVVPADFSATYCPPAIRLSVPLSAGGTGPLSPYISLGRQPISYSASGTLTAVDAYCDIFLENGGLLITFTKYPQSGSVYGEFFTIPDAKYVQFGLPGYGDIYPGTFSASFFAI